MLELKVKIRKDIPVPEDKRVNWRPILEDMEIGNSFVIPDGVSKYARQSIKAWGKANNMKFKVVNGTCWRVK